MVNLKYLKNFLEENKQGVYTEVNLIEKAIIRPPCLIIEPVKSKKKSKNKMLNFRIIFIDIELAYNGVLEFGRKTEDLLNFLEEHEMFEKNFSVLDREIYWGMHSGEGFSYYKAVSEYEIDETLASKKELEDYLLMRELNIGGMTNGDA